MRKFIYLYFILLIIQLLHGFLVFPIEKKSRIVRQIHKLSSNNDNNQMGEVWSLGVDYGTSGVRTCLLSYSSIDREYVIKSESQLLWSNELLFDSPDDWMNTLYKLLLLIPIEYRAKLNRICVSGTSSTCCIYDSNFKTASKDRGTRMYNYNVLDPSHNKDKLGEKVMKLIKDNCTPDSAASASTSTLAKLLYWQLENPLIQSESLVHQSDFVVNTLTNHNFYKNDGNNNNNNNKNELQKLDIYTDYNNALKLGYDVSSLTYPQWFIDLLQTVGLSNFEEHIPNKVLEPGAVVGKISKIMVDEFGISPDCEVVAGTTDSIAAFIASGADQVGQAVTSLGSTLAIKALSANPVEDSRRGIYSHRLGDLWLVGGASNVGCAILRQEGFSNDELSALSADIDPSVDCDLRYYPLPKPGERFPTNDPQKIPVLSPKPLIGDEVDRKTYLKGILQSIAYIERDAFEALGELGASPVTEVFTAGGGSKNDMWTAMRGRILQKKTMKAVNVDAAYGCARLGLKYL